MIIKKVEYIEINREGVELEQTFRRFLKEDCREDDILEEKIDFFIKKFDNEYGSFLKQEFEFETEEDRKIIFNTFEKVQEMTIKKHKREVMEEIKFYKREIQRLERILNL